MLTYLKSLFAKLFSKHTPVAQPAEYAPVDCLAPADAADEELSVPADTLLVEQPSEQIVFEVDTPPAVNKKSKSKKKKKI
jgi:hypothetical protein